MITPQEVTELRQEFLKKQRDDFEAAKQDIIEIHCNVIRHCAKAGDKHYDLDGLHDLVGYKSEGLEKLTMELADAANPFREEIAEEFRKLGFSVNGTRIILG